MADILVGIFGGLLFYSVARYGFWITNRMYPPGYDDERESKRDPAKPSIFRVRYRQNTLIASYGAMFMAFGIFFSALIYGVWQMTHGNFWGT